MAQSYPIQLRLAGRKCVVIGGGRVAARKVRRLREADADVHVLSPEFCHALAVRCDIVRYQTAYGPEHLSGAVLVFACTDNRELNRRIARDARQVGVWCNVADDPDTCDFFVPARLKRGRLQVSVSTDGAGPQLAASLKNRLESELGPEYTILTEELGRARRIVQERVPDPRIRREILATLCAECSLKLLRRKNRQAWRDWFERLLRRRLEKGVSE